MSVRISKRVSFKSFSKGNSIRSSSATSDFCKETGAESSARNLEQIMDENNEQVHPAIPVSLQNHELPGPGLDRTEADLKKVKPNPPLPCRDKRSLWKLLQEYETTGGGRGMLRGDILNSIPGEGVAAAAIEVNQYKLFAVPLRFVNCKSLQ